MTPYLDMEPRGLRPKPADVDMAQTPWEFAQLVELVARQQPQRILEIGTWYGGTLWYWLQIADLVVSVDDAMRAASRWRGWSGRNGRGRLRLIQGSSHDAELIARVRSLGPFDVVFIDADHVYSAVQADWEAYAPMVRPGGLVAFHDITPRPDYGVHQLWREIQAAKGTRTVEIVETWNKPEPGWGGVGVVWR